MYNLFVTGQEGVWDNLFYSYPDSRFLEYTTEEIAKKFNLLDANNIEELKSFPCVFAYEGEDKNVRIGRLTSIKKQDRKVRIEFEFYPDIPPIPFSSIKPIAELLDIRDWEMNRTHWAVKDENLMDRLLAHQIINEPEFKPSIVSSSIKKQSKISSPKVSTVRGFMDKIFIEKHSDDIEIFYRGHSNKGLYKLEPSLFRKDINGNYLYLDSEDVLYRELIVSNSSEFSADQYTLDKLVKMQHYSLPTRLLDITSNPLIALYFACKSNTGDEGEVVSFSLKRNLVKYFDSDTVSCLANLARLPKSDKDDINWSYGVATFNKQLSIQRLLHFIREEKSFFEQKIEPDDLRKIICVKGKKNNDRISSQSGAFLLFGLDTVLNEGGTEDIKVTRITISDKTNILKELDILNINESTVFPYIENSAKYVAEKYKFKPPIRSQKT